MEDAQKPIKKVSPETKTIHDTAMGVGGGAAVKMQRVKNVNKEDSFIDTKSLEGKERDDFIKSQMPRIRLIAQKLLRKLPGHEQNYMDDMVSVGFIGLDDAMRRYKPDHGEMFVTFSEKRIRGEMLDFLRKKDHIKRNIRKKIKKFEEALAENKTRLERGEKALTDIEMAQRVGLNLKSLKDSLFLQNYIGVGNPISIEGGKNKEKDPDLTFKIPDDRMNPEKVTQRGIADKVLDEAFEYFIKNQEPPAKAAMYKRIFRKYFIEGIVGKQIGLEEASESETGEAISESRVHQILKKIAKEMKIYMDKKGITIQDFNIS